MAIQQTKNQSDLEKRLKLLRLQVYGKQLETTQAKVNQPTTIYSLPTKKTESKVNLTYEHASNTAVSRIVLADINYLRQDLLKISILASLAMGVQIVLYFLWKEGFLHFLLRNNILKLPFAN